MPRPAAPSALPRTDVYRWAGILIIVLVGGVALGLSVSTLTGSCTGRPSGLPPQGSVLCGDTFVTGAIEAVVAAAALVLGLFLMVLAHIAPLQRIPTVAGILVAVVLVVAAVPGLVPAPAPMITARPELTFPMAAGTSFTATQGAFDAFMEPAIPADRYVPWAIIELQGAWSAASAVCLAVTRVQGSTLGENLGVVCGTAVSFVFVLEATTYVFAFYLPSDSNVTQVQVVITSDVGIVY